MSTSGRVPVNPVSWTALLGAALFSCLLTLGLWSLPALAQEAAPGQAVAPAATCQLPDFAPGEILVGMASRVEGAALQSDAGSLPVLEILSLSTGEGTAVLADTAAHAYRLQVPVGQEWAVIQQLQRQPDVHFATPNWLVFAADSRQSQPEVPYPVDDPLYAGEQWYLQRLNASRAWQAIFSETHASLTSVQVAVIDTGVDYSHPDLVGRLLAGRNYISPTLSAADLDGHGTHVAGLIAATTHNGKGIAGLAPNALIDPRKVLQTDACGRLSGTIANVAQAIRDATDAGARVINLSLDTETDHPVLRSAVQYAWGKGVLLVAAAGNQGTAVRYPAAYPEVMAVAATDYFDRREYYSNTGPAVEIAAPGGDTNSAIRSTWSSQVVAASKCALGYMVVDGGAYCRASGTSMATGLVSGVAALAWGLRPGLTAADVRAILNESAWPLDGTAEQVGSGRLDAHAAVRRTLLPDLLADTSQLRHLAPSDAAPISVTLHIENPSAISIPWEASVSADPHWLAIARPGGVPTTTGTLTGAVQYGQPLPLTVVLSPTGLSPGIYVGTLRLRGTRPDGARVSRTVEARLTVYAAGTGSQVYLPLVAGGQDAAAGVSFRWETPLPGTRTVYGLTDNSSVGISLPFSLTLRSRTYQTARLYSNGVVSLGEELPGVGLPNGCLINRTAPPHAIYGWWADLDPGAGGTVSTFSAAADKFVIEYERVPAAVGSVPPGASAYLVTFQVVLHRNGAVGLNYREAPGWLAGNWPRVTVGVTTLDGRFRGQVACVDEFYRLGTVPGPRQSYLIQPEELY